LQLSAKRRALPASSTRTAESCARSPSTSSSTSSSTGSSTGGSYVVQSGDTLSLIARAQGVSGGWRALYDANRGVVSDPNLIYPGQQLVLS